MDETDSLIRSEVFSPVEEFLPETSHVVSLIGSKTPVLNFVMKAGTLSIDLASKETERLSRKRAYPIS